MRASRLHSGNALGWVLVLLALSVAAAAAWNYRRNLVADQAVFARHPQNAEEIFRPFERERDRDLDVLIEAYTEEIEMLDAKWKRLAGARHSVSGVGHHDQRVAEFEAVQKETGKKRRLSAKLGELKATLRDLEAEKAYRAHGDQQLETLVRRLVSM